MTQFARMFPPGDGRHTSIKVARGTVYAPGAGGFVDVPSFDAHVLAANGWTRAGGTSCLVGATSARPASTAGHPLADGESYIDTTIGAMLTWQTSAGFAGVWRNVVTGAVA